MAFATTTAVMVPERRKAGVSRRRWRAGIPLATALALVLSSLLPWPVAPERSSDRIAVEDLAPRDLALVPMQFCWEQFEGMAHESVARLKRDVLSYQSPSANDHFIAEAVTKEPPKGALFFHVDNVLLKQLNDVIFRDKALSAATESLWTRTFFELLEADVGKNVKGAEMPWVSYSDYKTIRIGFRHASPELEAWLRSLYERASDEFGRRLGNYRYVDGLLRRRGGQAAEPYQWHVGGFGESPGGAAAASRAARYEDAEPGAVKRIEDARSEGLQEALAIRLRSLEDLRARVETDARAMFDGLPPFLTKPDKLGVAILSKDAIDVFKRLDDLEGEQFVHEATKAFRKRFERRFPDAEDADWAQLLLQARQYYRAIDPFLPPIYETQEVFDMGHAEAKHGVVSYDLIGANRDNQFAFMAMMAETMATAKERKAASKPLNDADLVNLAIGNAKRGQRGASAVFLRRRERFVTSVRQLEKEFPELGEGKIVLSGDDALYLPANPLAAKHRDRLHAIQVGGGTPDDGRMTFLPPFYSGAEPRKEVPPLRRAAFTGFSEAAEKHLRIQLEAEGIIPRSRLRKIGIAVDLEANDVRAGTVSLILAGEVSDADKAAIEKGAKAMLPDGFKYGTTRVMPPK